MELEILRGPAMYYSENLRCGQLLQEHRALKAETPATLAVPDESIPASRGEYAEVYSTKHERILLRVDHITKMDAIRRSFNSARPHPGKRALTTSDIVNAALDFTFEHRIPLFELQEADGLKELISKSIYRSVLSRWRQFNETFD
jgi:hypothetical protein